MSQLLGLQWFLGHRANGPLERRRAGVVMNTARHGTCNAYDSCRWLAIPTRRPRGDLRPRVRESIGDVTSNRSPLAHSASFEKHLAGDGAACPPNWTLPDHGIVLLTRRPFSSLTDVLCVGFRLWTAMGPHRRRRGLTGVWEPWQGISGRRSVLRAPGEAHSH